jgi:uncharacterized protein (DUF58 family)
LRIYPTRRAIALAATGAPVALLVALAAPHLWTAAAAWVVMTLGMMIADAVLAAPASGLELALRAPRAVGLGAGGTAVASAHFSGRAPREVEIATGGDARLTVTPPRQRLRLEQGRGEATLALTPRRRGPAQLAGLWARWRGPLGLVWLQQQAGAQTTVAVTPDVERVKAQALDLFARDSLSGLKVQRDLGDSGDFHALRDFQTGMDVRSIDWKQSARHGRLVSAEHRSERNHHIMLAIDCGRLMSQPTARGPRIDQALNAALLLAFVGLKMGDRVGLFAFDARPGAQSGLVAGAQAFPLLQRLAAEIDYSTEETNFTLGLTTLAGRLDRRALVVVFTDFADPTSAELMLENVGRLMRTHLVLFIAFRDAELGALVEAEPQSADDVSRAVIAGRLMKQRDSVVARLRRAGAEVVDPGADDLGLALVDSYLAVKRRGRI